MTFRQVHREERYIPLYRLVVTLRLFATHGFPLTRAGLWGPWPQRPALAPIHPCYSRRLSAHKFSSLARDRPIIASLLMTSSRDLRPRLRTFIISSSVLEIRSSTVLMLARFRQL